MNITKGKVAKAQKVVLYGPEGIGKSSLAAQFPSPLFIDTEGSTLNMDVARMDKPSSWQFLHQQIEFVKQNRPCKTLIIDTIDWAELLCNEHVCAQHNVKGIEDFGYGKGYVYSTEEFGRLLNKLSDVIEAGINVVLTAHSQIVKFEQPDEMGAYDRYQLKLGKGTGSRTAALIKEWADMILFLNYKTFSVAADKDSRKYKAQGGERTMYATHHPAWDAKNRFSLPDELPMDYSQIAHIFNEEALNQVEHNWSTQEPQQAPPEPSVTQQETAQEPKPEPEPQPEQQTPVEQPTEQQEPAPYTTGELDPNLPQSLRDLMTQHSVTEDEIQIVVSEKGYYPADTPLINYDPSFIEGVLVGAWEQVHGMVKNLREKIPFN